LISESRASASIDRAPSGARVRAARRRAGMSQKELASRLGVSIWTVDQLERGAPAHGIRTADVAAVADVHPEFLIDNEPTSDGAPKTMAVRAPLAADAYGHRFLVLASLAAIVLVRFFTEVVPIIPRAANFIDVPVLVTLGLGAIVYTRKRSPPGAAYLSVGGPVVAFLVVCAASAVLNPSRVAIGPALVFVYGILAPLGIYAAVYRLWPGGNAASMTRLLFALGISQFVVVLLIDLPRFFATGDPDQISGTFGTNQYQLVFFMLLFTTLLAAAFTFEPRRVMGRAAPLLIPAALIVIFLAQYRALLLTTAVSMVLVAVMLRHRGRGLLSATVAVAALVFALAYVASAFPELRFARTLSTYRSNPVFYASERLKVAGSLVDVYTEEPAAAAIGTGPGTYSSRGWQTFALANSPSRANVAGPYASLLSGGNAYGTDVSDRYVLPRYHGGAVVEGSGQLASPLFEYVSLLAEVGVLGFLMIAGVYVVATVRLLHQAGAVVRDSALGDALPALFITSAVALTALLQMGFLDNWLEVTRVTFVSWMLLAVAQKELDARSFPLQ
jgi:transcriptional regulator with XRE-family HTH domain